MASPISERTRNGLSGPAGSGQTAGQPVPPVTEDQPTAAGVLEQLAERLGAQARAATIYGEPIDRGGVTVIPVARAMWGFGGGAGHDNEQQAGAGGGGGASVSPVGYIEIKDGVTSFRPIFKPPVGLIAAVVGLVVGLLLGRALGRRDALASHGSLWQPQWTPSWAAGHVPSWRQRRTHTPQIGLLALAARLRRLRASALAGFWRAQS